MKKNSNEEHHVYHIKSIRKIGATEDLHQRVTVDQGFSEDEYDVVCTTTSLEYASDVEEALQKLYGYRVDTQTYKSIKDMKKFHNKMAKTATWDDQNRLVLTSATNTGNVGVNLKFTSVAEVEVAISNGVVFSEPATGTKITFAGDEAEEVAKLAVKSQYPTSDFFFRFKKLQNLRDELDMEYANQEMTAAHEMWNMTQDHPELEKPYINPALKATMMAGGWCGTPDLWKEEGYKMPIVVDDKRQQNKCSDLEVGNHTSIDLDRMMLMQKSLQQLFPSTANIGDSDVTLAEIAAMAQRNWHAFTDEYCEFMDAIGGINDGIKNGAWKYWKADHQLAQTLTLKDLSDADLKELHMEVVDMLHFFMNFALMVGMSGSDLFNMYMSKHQENEDRQKRNY